MAKHRLLKLLIQNTIVQLIIASVFYLLFLSIAKVMSEVTEEKALVVMQFHSAGQAVSGSGITERMSGSTPEGKNKPFISFPAESKLYQKSGRYYFQGLEGKDTLQVINPEYPVILENGAYLYLYHNDFTLITEDFEAVAAAKDSYLSEGMIFDGQRQRVGDKRVLALKLANGLYMNLQQLLLTVGNTQKTIDADSIIRFDHEQIAYCNIFDKKLAVNQLSVTDEITLISIDGQGISYDSFYAKLNTEASEKLESIIDRFELDSDIYQYFLGNRYTYCGNKTFYRTGDGYIMDLDGNLNYLTSAPLYYQKGKKLLLPSDYVLIQPRLYLMNKMSAMTEVTYDSGAVYAEYGDELDTYVDLLLFDGTDTYLFFNNATITWGDQRIKIAPMSSVTVGEDGSIGIYSYSKKKYLTYQADAYQDINAVIKKVATVNLRNDIMTTPDGQEQLLFTEPSLLSNAE